MAGSGYSEHRPVLRAKRLFIMMKLFSDGGRYAAEQLAELFDVSERTVFRDIRDLKSIDVPILLKDGKYRSDRRQWNVWGVKEVEQALKK